MKTSHPYWIKTRYNPQTGTYYVAEGQLSKTAAKRHEKPLYGFNIMTPYPTEAEYQAALAKLRATGERVQ